MKTLFSLLSIFAVGVALVGCEPMPTKPAAGEHEHSHEGPANYTSAIADIEKYQGQVKAAFDKNQIEDAHDALHEIGHAIEAVGKFAAQEGLAEEDVATAKKAAESLLEAFGAIDETLHGGTGKNYGEVAEQIDTAIATLKSLSK